MIGYAGCSTDKYDLAGRRTQLAAPGAERSHEDERRPAPAAPRPDLD